VTPNFGRRWQQLPAVVGKAAIRVGLVTGVGQRVKPYISNEPF